MKRDVFWAIADPTRRKILHLLADQTLNMEAITSNFALSRSAIYKHVRILLHCDLIGIQIKGRERYCTIKLEKLNQVTEWVKHYQLLGQSHCDLSENYFTQL